MRLGYLNISTPDFNNINHGYSTHGFIDHSFLAPFALATSTMAQRDIIHIEYSCRFQKVRIESAFDRLAEDKAKQLRMVGRLPDDLGLL
uniref:Uncharacterized protein n=1 Tax=Oryza rufipogon TaxID=4529 RepID=A0A0E0QHH1_ORYRU